MMVNAASRCGKAPPPLKKQMTFTPKNRKTQLAVDQSTMFEPAIYADAKQGQHQMMLHRHKTKRAQRMAEFGDEGSFDEDEDEPVDGGSEEEGPVLSSDEYGFVDFNNMYMGDADFEVFESETIPTHPQVREGEGGARVG